MFYAFDRDSFFSSSLRFLLRYVSKPLVCVTVLVSLTCSVAVAEEELANKISPVDFNRDIRPILSDRCFHCHGPNDEDREGELRFDERSDPTRDRDGVFVIKPGDADASTIFERLASHDPDMLMPPVDSGKDRLTGKELTLIRRWIDEGAVWSGHWAFTPPVRPEVPKIVNDGEVRNPIDAFVLSQLGSLGRKPSPEASKIALLRRLSLDLIGLPPTIDEVDQFLADKSTNAYEKLVDRLLASPHYGERWGRIWLDAARYADSDGYEKDQVREVWFYRDWVIKAFNQDMPYDQFVIEQLAGDLLPNATQEQIVATGFLRNSMVNEEGGIDPEEFRMAAMFDRMDAVGKAVLGFTMQCAQCHSHKYDPIKHGDYYSMFAFLNNCHERQMAVYLPEQEKKRQDVLDKIAEIENDLKAVTPDWQDRMTAWEKSLSGQPEWTVLTLKNLGDNKQRFYQQSDGSYLARGYAPSRIKMEFEAKVDDPMIRSFQLEFLIDPNLPLDGPGRGPTGMVAMSEFMVEVSSINEPDKKRKVKFVRATADYSNPKRKLGKLYAKKKGATDTTGSVDFAIDRNQRTAWGIDAGPGRRNQSRKAVFVTNKNVAFPEGTVLTFTMDQSAGGLSSANNYGLTMGRYRLSVTGGKVDADPLPAKVREVFKTPVDERTAEQQQLVFSYWRTTISDWQDANDQIEAIWKQHPESSSQLVLQERKVLRPTHRLERGNFLQPQEQVAPNVPEFLHAWPEGVPKNRLTFARWMVDRKSPTTARAIVNRVWQAYFGVGLVSTAEDFGSQGEVPRYPKVIDWLAVELMDNGWSLKHLHRQIVLSGTYRQSSKISPELQAEDPSNRLLARGARFRVDAEIVRDIFLTASGLLTPTVGGPSVYPPAPKFLFSQPVSFSEKIWNFEKGANKYRRAVYTFRYRSVPYPVLHAFDAPSGEYASVRRTRSNSPLQALTTLNETLFMECAQSLAKKTLQDGGKTDHQRVAYAFRRCVARLPEAEEEALLVDLLEKQMKKFSSKGADPWAILVNEAGKRPELAKNVDPAKLAAWTVVSRVLLNMDETITKE